MSVFELSDDLDSVRRDVEQHLVAVVGPGGDSRHRKMLVAVAAQVLDGFYGAVPAFVDDGQGVRLPSYSVVTSENPTDGETATA